MGGKRNPAAVLCALIAVCAGAFSPVPAQDLQLSADSPFAVLGSTITFTLSGPPDASYFLKASAVPQESQAPGWGTVFLDLGKLIDMGSGMIPASGEATIALEVPATPGLAGQVFYFQGGATLGADRMVSNSVAVRLAPGAPSGPRRPVGIAVTPDGTKAYVVHSKDGTVSVLDALTDTPLAEIPVAAAPAGAALSGGIAVDPDGRHVFVSNPAARHVTAIHVATDSVAARIPVPGATREFAFDFTGSDKIIFATNERDHSLLRIRESPPGTFNVEGAIPLQGRGPGSVVRLADGTLAVAHRQSRQVERIDPVAPAGQTTLALRDLGSAPYDLVVLGGRLFVPTFTPDPGEDDGRNEVLELDPSTLDTLGAWLPGAGTDYFVAAATPAHLVLAGSGSGVVVVADAADLGSFAVVDLVPGGSPAVPRAVAFVPGAGAGRLYVANRYRETIRPVDLSSGPPYGLLPEIPLAWAGRPLDPRADLGQVERGEWYFDSVAYFNGTALNPNPVTCATCHTDVFSSGFRNDDGLDSQALFDLGSTGPWLYSGVIPSLLLKTQVLFDRHGRIGGTLDSDAEQSLTQYQTVGMPVPQSPFLQADGSLSPSAAAGKVVFEGAAGCSGCHTAPRFIPLAPAPATIAGGVGTGLAPANVPSLRGLWATGPYLHDGSAPDLMQVLTVNSGDQHGTTSTLTQQELDDLVAYLLSL